MNRHNHSHSQNTAPRGRPVSSLEEAHANNSFEHFLTASTLKTIFGTYRNVCEYLHLKPNVIPLFYPKLKAHVNSWKAKPLWKKFDARANQKCYGRGKICPNTRVLIIGAGPCGLRTAIEAQLLGAKVVIVEKRDRLSRNNVLHLWPFVIDDLRALGAKKFFGKFCAGAIDHISIRQLQCILLKVALLLGVEIHTEVSYEDLIEPNPAEKTGWRAQFKPVDHPVSQYEFDVIIGADGKRNTLQGFKRKEFRGKLAIAITANFINKRTEAEARVEEISGVAFIFNQKFFKDLYAETGIDLENIVYYKDDTHYFVMTAKKQSLIEKGVIKQDLSDTERLLAPDNVDREELMNYAREAAEFSTNYQMPDLEFAVNHYGQPDVAMFDFTSMYAADNASRIIDRHSYKLLAILVGDSLLEPFWPTGSGCARGFLSSMDAAWAIRGWGSGNTTPLEVVAERESIYRLLAQTTPENLNKDYKSYTLDPSTRYPNLNKNALLPHQVTSLYDTDNPKSIELKPRSVLTNVEQQLPKKRRRHDSHVDPDTLLSWIKDQVREHEDLEINDITTSFKDGRVLCAILHHYRPDLLDFAAMNNQEPAVKNQQLFDLLEKELGIPPVMTGEELVSTEVPDFLSMLSYLSQVYDTFRCEIPHIKHPKLFEDLVLKTSTLDDHLKPTLLTPKSSTLISHEGDMLNPHKKTVIISSSESHSELEQIPTKQEKLGEVTRTGLILIPIKSIEDYVLKCGLPKISFRQRISNTKSLKSSSELDKVKSHPMFQKTIKRVRLKKGVRDTKVLRRKKCCANLRKLIRLREKNDEITEEKTTTSTSRGSSVIVSDFIYNMSADVKKNPFDCEMTKVESTGEEVSKTTGRDISSSIAGSSEITMEFLKEMDLFLRVQSLASEKLQEQREKLKVDIKFSEFERPMCDDYDGIINDVTIKNIETEDGKTVAIHKINCFSLKSCSSSVPKFVVKVTPRLLEGGDAKQICQSDIPSVEKFPFKMSKKKFAKPAPKEALSRVEGWIISSPFDSPSIASSDRKEVNIFNDNDTDITSVTKRLENAKFKAEATNAAPDNSKNCNNEYITTKSQSNSHDSTESIANFMKTLKNNQCTKGITKMTNFTSRELYEGRMKSKPEPPAKLITTIVEGEECELPETKRGDSTLKFHTPFAYQKNTEPPLTLTQPARPSSRHKRHIDPNILNKTNIAAISTQDRKARKRKTLEKVGASVEERQRRLEEIALNRVDRQSKRRQQRKQQTEQFIKSMQMLQSNCKPDHSEPFEDYSIFLYRQTAPNFEDRVKDLEKKFTYVPDRENRLPPSQVKRETDEDFAARIKDLEDKWREPAVVEKKPKDLLRAIGKIETSDWNIKEIEKKINENKLGKTVNKDKEKVPKWSREQFLARQNKMERQHLDRQDSTAGKYAEIDRNIKQLEHKLKEGTTRDLNQRKVASITEKLVGKISSEPPQPKPVQKSNSRVVIPPPNHGSEYCHFCSKRVYLMERLSAEGKFFHRGCFRCQYCQTLLRLGSYAFDREGLYGNKFFCPQHFGMPGELRTGNEELQSQASESPEKNVISGVVGVDLLDRVQTPERVKFSNLSTGHISSDHEESPSPIDEDEWTDRNFRNSVVDTDSSEDDSSSTSDTDSEDDEAFEEALEEPPTKEGTMRWAERYKKRYSRKHDDDSESDEYSSSDHFSYYENSSGEDESDTATEGEEEIRARELRKQEVRVEPPVTDTGTDTEIASDETTSETSSDEIQNSATEISTDSEFAQDDPTPTHDKPPSKIFDDFVTKTRGTYSTPKKVQVKSGVLQQPVNGRTTKNIELKFTPLVTTTSTPSRPPVVRKPAAPPTSLFGRTEGYALNRTQSTGGIAAKVSLELKKKYLLGETGSTGSIQKSGSASTLDLKFKSFHTNISDCQKLLKPAPEISASMQVFCTKLSERTSPLSPTFGSPSPLLSSVPKETIKTIVDATPKSDGGGIINESEGRPRSPVHERSIIVPTIDWEKNKQQNRQDKYVDSLSSSSSSSSSCDSHLEEKDEEKKKVFDNIPRLEVHDDLGEILQQDDGEMTLDSLNVIKTAEALSITETPKSITGERKTLNQPKVLPDLESDSILPEVHSILHIKHSEEEEEEADSKSVKNSSGRSTPSINDDLITTALTETELSDWARDGNVSDDLEEELNPILKPEMTKVKDVDGLRTVEKGNKNLEIENLEHVCGRENEFQDAKSKHSTVAECVNNILYPNLENIEFMDTGTETSSDENFEVKNNGYVQFHDEDEFVEDGLLPNLNHIIETTNPSVHTKNTGYCIIDGERQEQDKNERNGDVNLKQVNTAMKKQNNEEVVEPGTTTEENTCSDSTVKNLTEKAIESVREEKPNTQKLIESSFKDRKRLEDKLAQVKQDMAKLNELKTAEAEDDSNNIEFEEHCQRLQSKIEFSNVKDSIDIRKSRRKSKSEPVKPDLIQEEKVSPQKAMVLTPSKLYSKEEIEKERNLNQQLVQEMVMMKMRAQNKSLERKKRNRNSFSPIRPFELNRSATTDLSVQSLATPDVLLSTIPLVPLQKSQTTSLMSNPDTTPLVSLPDVSRTSDELFVTPKAPPRTKNDEAKRTAEKMKQDARARARLMSDEEFGLSPEDKIERLRQVAGLKKNKEASDVQDSIESLVINTERRNSLLYNDTLKRNTSFRRSKSGETQSSFDLSVSQPVRTKSVSEINRPICLPRDKAPIESPRKNQFCKSDPNLLLDAEASRKEKKKPKDRERRKSITKFLADIFSPKKKDASGSANKNFLSRISAKNKNKSKSCVALDQDDIDKMAEEKTMRRNSVSALDVRRDYGGNISPPPVPPLPENYSGVHLSKDESSDAENQGGAQGGHSSCDTLDQSGLHEGSLSSFSGRRSGRSARKAVRQAQLKRHRMAQEIQRKLEETEVKTRELERRGVVVEKALRGEVDDGNREEPELLKEWFDLMRDRTDLRRYERELTVRAQELELEDRHARLQHELRERLENDEPKTKEEMEVEGSIIKEMMDIVAKRDSLIVQIEEDRIRYAEEDRDFEEQMLAKGINLTPLVKSSPADK